MTGSVLEVRDVVKSWPRLEGRVLDRASLTLATGERARVVGANGAGKTTLMRVIAGLILPESGAVAVDGLDPVRQRADAQRRIGFLSAGDRGLYARLTVRQHLALWSRLTLMPKAEGAAAVQRSIDAFALGDLQQRRTDRLSMGQRQRLRVAMTFLHRPRLVLLDEPMNSLDEAGGELLAAAIDDTVADGGACLWISPGNDPALTTFDRAYVLAGGVLAAR